MTDENDQKPELTPEDQQAVEDAMREVSQDAKANFSLADWLQGGAQKKGNVLVYRDLDAVAEYAAAMKRQGEVEADLLELTKPDREEGVPTDEEVQAAKDRLATAEGETEKAKTAMLEHALNVVFRPIPGDVDDRVRAKARKIYYPNGQERDTDASWQSQDWIERTTLGHGIKELKSAHGSVPIENRDRIGHDLHDMLDFAQWTRLLTTWQVYRFGDAVADAAVSDPGF